MFETSVPDMAGHGRMGFSAAQALTRIDGLVEGVLEGRGRDTIVLLTSDPGNIEEASHQSHTRDPVPLLAVGSLAGQFAEATSILDMTPKILECLRPTPGRR